MDIPDINQNLIYYLREIPEAKTKVEEQMMKVYGQIDWAHQPDTELRILCTLTKEDKNVNNLKKDWNTKVKKSVESLSAGIKIEKRQCLKKVWRDICSEIERIKESHEAVAVLSRDSETAVYVAGPEKSIARVYDEVDKMCTEMEQSMDHIKDVVELNGMEKAIIGKADFASRLYENHPKLKITLTEEEVELDGPPKEVLSTQKELHNFLKKMEKRYIVLSKGKLNILDLLKKKDIDYLESSLKELTAIMHKEGDNTILFGKEEDLEEFEAIVTRSIKESSIEVTDEEQAAVRDNTWQKFCNELSPQCDDILYLRYNEDNSTINLVALDKDFDLAIEEIQKHIRNHAVKNFLVDLERPNNKLIGRWMKADLQKIERDFARYNIKIDSSDECGFHIFGLEAGLNPAKSRLENLKQHIIQDKHSVNTPGMPNYFTQQESGKYFLHGQEEEHHVVIQCEDFKKGKGVPKARSAGEEKLQRMATTELDQAKHSSGTVIKVFVGDIVTHKVDAIVNAANQKLQPSGGLAKQIVDQGKRMYVCSIQKHFW